MQKSVQESLRTFKGKAEDLDVRKRRTAEYCLGESLACAVQTLNEEKVTSMTHPPMTMLASVQTPQSTTAQQGQQPHLTGSSLSLNQALQASAQCQQQHSGFCSPLNTILERYANFEKIIGHMIAVNEMEMANFLGSDTPIAKLLNEDIPAVTAAKKDLEQLVRRQQQSVNNLEKQEKRLEKLQEKLANNNTGGNNNNGGSSGNISSNSSSNGFSNSSNHENSGENCDSSVDSNLELLLQQEMEKRDRMAFEVDNLAKDVSMEQDKLTSTLLTLVSRENRYASSVLGLIRIRKQFYETAFNTISAELPNIERILSETHLRPVFGERLEDHLNATGRAIAFPIHLAVTYLRRSGLSDEGLFRISPKQIRLDKFKAYLDSNISVYNLLADSDSHLLSALLKSYLRELPTPLLLPPCEIGPSGDHRASSGGTSGVYNRWIEASQVQSQYDRLLIIRQIVREELPPRVSLNVQFLVKFLAELSKMSRETKMTPHNIAIVLGPTLLWNSLSRSGSRQQILDEQSNIERVIAVVGFLIESYSEVFSADFEWDDYRDPELEDMLERIDREQRSSSDCEDTRSIESTSHGHHSSNSVSNSSSSSCSNSGAQQLPRPTSSPSQLLFLPPSPKDGGDGSPSPNHKRKASFRSKFLSKINSPNSKAVTPISPVSESARESGPFSALMSVRRLDDHSN